MKDAGHQWAVDRTIGAERFATWLRQRSGGREPARLVRDGARDLSRLAEDEDFEGLVVATPVPTSLLRELPCPVVVVPPGVDPTSLGSGPVLVGVELDDASVAAADFGRELGRRLDLPTVLVHAAPAAHVSLTPALDDWAERHGFDDLALETRIGGCRTELLEAAREHGASLIVCGSRRLSPIHRFFRSTTGTELAARAIVPVAVVPSPCFVERVPNADPPGGQRVEGRLELGLPSG